MPVTYQDFSVWLEANPSGTGLRVKARSPAGEASEALDLAPGLREQLARLFSPSPGTEAGAGRGASESRGVLPVKPENPGWPLRELGSRLFHTLLPGKVRHLYERSWGATPDPSQGLRLRLHLDPGDRTAAGLHSLPWELAYQAETRDFLGLNRRSPLVRYLEVPRAIQPPPVGSPLEILMVAARPSGSAPLDLEQERRSIEEECSGASKLVAIRVIERAGTDALHEALRAGSPHVVHFMGHGAFDEASGEGCLLLEGRDGGAEVLAGEVLANLLKGQLPRLVVINACDSARAAASASHDFFAGVATALVLGGVPAVVAMRAPISDDAALAFARRLYRELASGWPVDAATAEARLAIYQQEPYSPEWATPVVFLRDADGVIFGAQQAEEAASGPRPDAPGRRGIRVKTVRTPQADLDPDDLEIETLEASERLRALPQKPNE